MTDSSAGERWLREQAKPRGRVRQEQPHRTTAAELTSAALRAAVQRVRRRTQLPDNR